MPDAYRLPPGVPADRLLEHSLAALDRLLAEHHARIAALVIEPLVQAAAGIIVHPRGYLRGVRELTRKYDVLLIADEVAVGFGRTGRMFACEHEGVTPDLFCIAKGLTGGYLPMAATLATEEIWQAFLGDYASGRTFYHGHTYGGNPLGPRRPWPRSTSLKKSGHWNIFRKKSPAWASFSLPLPGTRTSAISANAG